MSAVNPARKPASTAPARPDQAAVLAALLVADESGISCEQCFDYLDRHVEAELRLPGSGIPGMAEHLRACPACDEDYESLRDFIATTETPATPGSKRSSQDRED